ncbi:hypothetical protein [Delftia phage PhiW-14]|uniref:Uncharacterized protein n=1 Tax=Delftia phage PhiW-14 TaxID=665032 RepID=C9DGC9_BPW14|nr:hypothetical protein DP-phiW-14_gp159 [Delftia phage PhiW-14]ACV50180.1 hypothetical protein [Delftia phage PhiW-14]
MTYIMLIVFTLVNGDAIHTQQVQFTSANVAAEGLAHCRAKAAIRRPTYNMECQPLWTN